MSFYNGILNLTNWAGNVIMPTLGALFIAVAVIQFALVITICIRHGPTEG